MEEPQLAQEVSLFIETAREPGVTADALQTKAATLTRTLGRMHYADLGAEDRAAFETLVREDNMRAFLRGPAGVSSKEDRQKMRGTLQALFVATIICAPGHMRALCAALAVCCTTPSAATMDPIVLAAATTYLARAADPDVETHVSDDDLTRVVQRVKDFIGMVDVYGLDDDVPETLWDDEIQVALRAARDERYATLSLALYSPLLNLLPIYYRLPPVRNAILAGVRQACVGLRDNDFKAHPEVAPRIVTVVTTCARDAPITAMDAHAMQPFAAILRVGPALAMRLGAVELMREWLDTPPQAAVQDSNDAKALRELRYARSAFLVTLVEFAETDAAELVEHNGLELAFGVTKDVIKSEKLFQLYRMCLLDPRAAPAACVRLAQAEVVQYLFSAVMGQTTRPALTRLSRVVGAVFDHQPMPK